MKRPLHALLVVGAFVPWAFGCACFAVALWLTVLADKLWPAADHGNCWSYAGPRWWRWGGYILVRPADDVRVMGRGFIPHAIWVKTMPSDASELEVEQTRPLHRSKAKWMPWRTLYFPFAVLRKERPHNAEVQSDPNA